MTEIILTSSILILLLAVLRRALRGRIDPRVQYALWLLVAARLLIPGTLFTAPVSVMGAAEEVQTAIRGTFPDPRAAEDSSPARRPAVQSVQPVQSVRPSPAANTGEKTEIPVDMAAPLVHYSRWDLVSWPDVIWKAGMAAVGGAMAVSNLLFYLRLRRTRRRLDLPAALRAGRLPVYEVEGLSSPCLFGLLRPAVYLNEAAVDAAHPEHILAHEYAHYRHGDQLWSILRSICLVIHWYNPLVWWAAALCRRDCELACDASALRRLGEGERIDYGQTLLGMISRSRNPTALLHTATTMSAGKRAMTERIALIAKAPRTRKITLVLAALLACVLAACAFGGGEPKAPEGTEPSSGGGTKVPLGTAPSEGADRESASASLMEFPGLRWNDSVEAVIGALGITEEQILENGEQSGEEDCWCLSASGVPAFGETAETAYFYFVRYGNSDWGLCSVRLDYPNDMNFGAVREELIRQYGPGSSARPNCYQIIDGTLMGVSGDLRPLAPGESIGQSMLDAYGQEALDQRREILEQDGPHRWYWSLDSSALPEGFSARGTAWYVKNTDGPVRMDNIQEYFRRQAMVQASWTDAAPVTLTRPSSTFNQVWLDASEYVHHFQRIDWDNPIAVTVSQVLSSDSSDSSYITDPAEVKRLWEMYWSFVYNGTYDSPTWKGGWPLWVSFHFGENPGDDDVSFLLSRDGITQDGENFTLDDIDRIYQEFLRVSEDTAYPFGPGPAQDVLADNARSIVEQIQQGADVGEWLPLMNYMDWSVLAQEAVEAGMDEGDGSMAVTELVMGAIDRYIARQGPSMTQAEYLYLLSATAGLDGAPSEGYAYTIYQLYSVNPSQFAYVVLEMLPETQRNEALYHFCFEWYFHRGTEAPPTQEEAIAEAAAQLEADLEASVSATPSEMDLKSAGSTFQFLLLNAPGVYALTYESSDTGVAEVDQNGVVTAAGPGEAVITMSYEGAGGPKEFTCQVQCAWQDAEASRTGDHLTTD